MGRAGHRGPLGYDGAVLASTCLPVQPVGTRYLHWQVPRPSGGAAARI